MIQSPRCGSKINTHEYKSKPSSILLTGKFDSCCQADVPNWQSAVCDTRQHFIHWDKIFDSYKRFSEPPRISNIQVSGTQWVSDCQIAVLCCGNKTDVQMHSVTSISLIFLCWSTKNAVFLIPMECNSQYTADRKKVVQLWWTMLLMQWEP